VEFTPHSAAVGRCHHLIRAAEAAEGKPSAADVFLGAKVRGVWHTGAQIPIGTRQLTSKALPAFVKSFSTPKHSTVLVSWLKNGGRDYIVVVNRDPNYEMSFTAKFAPGSELVRRDGTRARADAYEDLFWLEPGDAAIFAAPDSESSCELGESIKAFDKILPTP